MLIRPTRRRDWAAILAALVGVAALAVLAYAWSQAAADADRWKRLYLDTPPATVTVPVHPEDLGRVTS
jgi:hypothetical protein